MAVKRWNGTTWDVYAGADTSPGFAATDGRSGRRTYVGANTPTAPVDGDIWIDQDTATNAIPASAFDAKGDLMVGTGPDTYTRQAVGTDGQVLVADSSQADGVLWSHTPSRQGLVSIVPTSVAVGSGSASVGANGAVTIGSAVSSVTINGVFSSTYDNYKILINGVGGNQSQGLIMKLGSTATGYYGNLSYVLYTGTSYTMVPMNNTAHWFIGLTDAAAPSLSTSFDIVQPFLSLRSQIMGNYYGRGYMGSFGASLENSTSYTSFNIANESGTLTGGTIRIYGYGNGA
jgi:hypothetical protein